MSRLLLLVALLGTYAAARATLGLLTARARLREAQAMEARFRAHVDSALAVTREEWSAFDHDFAEDEGIELGCVYWDSAHKPEAI